MNTKTNKLIGELAARCVEMNCDTLHVFFNFMGHVDELDITYNLGGWHEDDVSVKLCSIYLNKVKSLDHIFTALDNLQAEHDELYAPENIAATQEATRLAKIAELQKQIEELS